MLPVFTDASSNDPLPWPDRLKDPKPGQVNAFFRWKTLRDAPQALEMSLFLTRPEDLKTSFAIREKAPADVTPRRLQALRIAPDEKVNWSFGAAKGEVRADASGCVTVPRLENTSQPATLVICRAG